MKTYSYRRLKDVLLKYLGRNTLMVLATSYENRPWCVTVFYTFTPKFEIIFYSRPDRIHSKHIEENPYVSIAIHEEFGRTRQIRGVQATGRAHRAIDKEKEEYYAVYEKRYSWANKFSEDHEIYVIEPLELYFIDEKLLGHTEKLKIL